MATRTTNFGLYKPDSTDDFGDFLPEFNANMDEIDNHLGGGGGSSTLSGLSDVNFSSLTAGDLLIYDGAEWINHSFIEGHTILNESGTAVTARDNLQFTDGLKVTDDSGNNKTKVGVNTTFTEASTRANINSGDTFSTILGKIRKWFTDIPNLFVNKTGDTMTGALSIKSSGAEVGLSVDYNHSYTNSRRAGIDIGNNKPDGTAGCTHGAIALYGSGSNYTILTANNSTGSRSIWLPDKNGELATTDDVNTRVSKSGDTMSGSLKINNGYSLELSNGTKTTGILKPPVSEGGNNDTTLYIPDKSGTLALKPTVELLDNNIFISTSDAWIGLMNPSLNLDNYEYIGFSWTMSDSAQTQKQIQTIMKMSDFKTSSQSAPVIIVDDPYSAFSDARRVKVAWDDRSSFSVYRGNEVYMYRRLNIFGINF